MKTPLMTLTTSFGHLMSRLQTFVGAKPNPSSSKTMSSSEASIVQSSGTPKASKKTSMTPMLVSDGSEPSTMSSGVSTRASHSWATDTITSGTISSPSEPKDCKEYCDDFFVYLPRIRGRYLIPTTYQGGDPWDYDSNKLTDFPEHFVYIPLETKKSTPRPRRPRRIPPMQILPHIDE